MISCEHRIRSGNITLHRQTKNNNGMNCDDEEMEDLYSEREEWTYDYEEAIRDCWDAMTDGQYGDMPEGFDNDYDFLGY